MLQGKLLPWNLSFTVNAVLYPFNVTQLKEAVLDNQDTYFFYTIVSVSVHCVLSFSV